MNISNTPIIGKFLIIIGFFGLLSVGSTIFSAAKMQVIDDGYSDAIEPAGRHRRSARKGQPRPYRNAGRDIGTGNRQYG